jgi:hypothetical protein
LGFQGVDVQVLLGDQGQDVVDLAHGDFLLAALMVIA